MLQWFCALEEVIRRCGEPLPSMNHWILANCPHAQTAAGVGGTSICNLPIAAEASVTKPSRNVAHFFPPFAARYCDCYANELIYSHHTDAVSAAWAHLIQRESSLWLSALITSSSTGVDSYSLQYRTTECYISKVLLAKLHITVPLSPHSLQ